MDHSSLHHFIISTFLRSQRAPSVAEIATQFSVDVNAAREALRALADYHGVVLHPNSDEVWVSHPFSAAPTTYIVCVDDKKWWGNCAWCSLGVIHLAGGTGTFTTRTGSLGDDVTVAIRNGQLVDTDFVIHFPLAMRSCWDNVIYTCSIQLLFRDTAEVDDWCKTRGIPKGDVRPLQQVWDFAKEWYGRHADPDWKKWTLKDAIQIFARHNLDGPIWSVSEDGSRF